MFSPLALNVAKDVTHENQVRVDRDAGIVGFGEGHLQVAHTLGHRHVVDVADDFGIDGHADAP
ncbi:MAG TPA: hypothetical protein VJ801_14195 [Polyangia bacterium]|jgi:hypothetical protein|nr:hypothetical protein [Polyangia bacterium]